MANNRVIKTDGDLDITANDTSVSGTLTVSGQATISGLAYPTSDGSADQVLVTNGSGALSFADAASGGGVDTVTSASEAASYSGTNRIIYITASENVVFTIALSDRIIINKNDYEVKFQADVTNCIIQSDNNIKIENTSVDTTTTVNIKYSKINCNNLEIIASGDEVGNDMTVEGCEINCRGNFTFGSASSSIYAFINNNLYCGGDFITGSGVNAIDIILSNVSVKKLNAQISLPSTNGDSEFRARSGTASSSGKVTIQGQVYLNGLYSNPFVANIDGIKTNVIVKIGRSTSQNIFTTSYEKLQWNNELIDNTSIFDPNVNYRMTTKIKGYYKIYFSPQFSGINTSDIVGVQVYKNGGASANDRTFAFPLEDAGTSRIASYNTIMDLDIGDYIEIYAYSGDGTYSFAATGSILTFEKIN